MIKVDIDPVNLRLARGDTLTSAYCKLHRLKPSISPTVIPQYGAVQLTSALSGSPSLNPVSITLSDWMGTLGLG